MYDLKQFWPDESLLTRTLVLRAQEVKALLSLTTKRLPVSNRFLIDWTNGRVGVCDLVRSLFVGPAPTEVGLSTQKTFTVDLLPVDPGLFKPKVSQGLAIRENGDRVDLALFEGGERNWGVQDEGYLPHVVGQVSCKPLPQLADSDPSIGTLYAASGLRFSPPSEGREPVYFRPENLTVLTLIGKSGPGRATWHVGPTGDTQEFVVAMKDGSEWVYNLRGMRPLVGS